jgi:hypothetical protein
MLNLDDQRWNNLKGGYRLPFDPRSLFRKLELSEDVENAWAELWGELHHQGDVGEASYAAVPHLVRIYRQRGIADWNTYAFVATIELARGQGKNPKVPDWLESDDFAAIHELAKIGLTEREGTTDPDQVRGILSMLAIDKGTRTYGRVLLNYSEEELDEFEPGQISGA